ncbi:MAG: aminotransferase class I/II-fold pyridoxal phosphate-dependent enzyme [Eubacteriales bacterium]|nr:aminotransferase class I/II-fold pyridoxal phosphate-dependent enzyme [Eubacteriales bacterium]
MKLDNEQLYNLTHGFEDYAGQLGAISPPVYFSSLHVFPTFEEYMKAGAGEDEEAFIYGRVSNPTARLLEQKLAALEHGEDALVFSSGMAAATSAILGTCQAGDHILCMRDSYRPVHRFMAQVGKPRLNIDISFVSGQDLEEIRSAIRPTTRLMILESPATFVFSVVDLKAIADICCERGVKTYMDNTYATPLNQNPLDFGIDIVMHTLSKYVGGHSDLIGGALISRDGAWIHEMRHSVREWLGGILGPMEAWLAIRGLRSLAARLAVHQDTAMKVALFLERHPKVKRVHYTGLMSHPQADLIARQMRGHTGLMSFELDRSPEDAVRMINALKLYGKGCSWGGYESLALCPMYGAEEEELRDSGVSRGLVRIHCGLEGADNLIADLTQALEQV